MNMMNALKHTENSEKAYPIKRKRDYASLIIVFLKALFSREKKLPESILRQYLEGFINKREVFMDSAEKFGTPQYFYDYPNLKLQIERFKAAFSKYLPRFQIFYAIKSNCFRGMVDDIAKAGIGLDASSGRELSMALETGCEKILFTGPGKTDEELNLAFANRSRVILLIDSFGELGRLSRLIQTNKKIDSPLTVGVRVKELEKSSWNKFGIPINDLSIIFEKALRINGIIPSGIQFHSSWNMDPYRQTTMIKDLGRYLDESMPGHLRRYLKFIDIGGGFWPEHGEFLHPNNTLAGKVALLLGADIKLKESYRKLREKLFSFKLW